MNLMIFGLGYSAANFLDASVVAGKTTATVTTAAKARSFTRPGLDVRVFAPDYVDDEIQTAIARADAALVSIGPDADGDPTLNAFTDAIVAAPNLRTIVYLSTIGVYGDYAGAWIDESAECRPMNARSKWRLEAETRWIALGERAGKTVHVLRLAGIYGPGRNALVNLKNGTARRIVQKGQVFNRIHVADIGAAIAACLTYRGVRRIWNVTDEEPASGADVVACAADLLGIDPPPEIPLESAALSPMARSFYGESKRVSNKALRAELDVGLAYPTYREGLRALLEAGEGR